MLDANLFERFSLQRLGAATVYDDVLMDLNVSMLYPWLQQNFQVLTRG